MRKPFALLLFVTLLTGCAGPHPQSLAMVRPNYVGEINGGVHIVVSDHRPYVQSGDKSRQFLGTRHRAMHWGMPENIINASAKPVADELAEIVATSLVHRGATLCSGTKPDMLCSEAKQILLTLQDWRFSWSRNSELKVNAELTIKDKTGTVLAQARVEAHEPLLRANVQQAFQQTLERLLNQEQVVNALR